jgi:hypothetical protein
LLLDEEIDFDLSSPLNRKISLVPDDEFIPVSPVHHGHQNGVAYRLDQVSVRLVLITISCQNLQVVIPYKGVEFSKFLESN